MKTQLTDYYGLVLIPETDPESNFLRGRETLAWVCEMRGFADVRRVMNASETQVLKMLSFAEIVLSEISPAAGANLQEAFHQNQWRDAENNINTDKAKEIAQIASSTNGLAIERKASIAAVDAAASFAELTLHHIDPEAAKACHRIVVNNEHTRHMLEHEVDERLACRLGEAIRRRVIAKDEISGPITIS